MIEVMKIPIYQWPKGALICFDYKGCMEVVGENTTYIESKEFKMGKRVFLKVCLISYEFILQDILTKFRLPNKTLITYNEWPHKWEYPLQCCLAATDNDLISPNEKPIDIINFDPVQIRIETKSW